MYDRELVLEIASQIHNATRTILKRFEVVQSPGDFTDSEAGMEKLDSICMQLIAIGEGLKNLDKVTDHSLLPCYPQVAWKKAKGLRDIISHHYFDVNAEAIFEVCKTHIPILGKTIATLMDDVASTSQGD
ncbi:MAG: DUF86 domain-containing protein [Deltaproteobacteria bacterium]|nr:DUF86 domain-containing protein [Deltaproteobacteria bacterium]